VYNIHVFLPLLLLQTFDLRLSPIIELVELQIVLSLVYKITFSQIKACHYTTLFYQLKNLNSIYAVQTSHTSVHTILFVIGCIKKR